MLKRYWRAETGLFLGIWLALMVLGRTRLFGDPGTLWHTAAGRRVLDSGRLVEADSFSFTFGGRPWVPHSWLAECAMAAVDRVAGLDGLLLLTATALAATYAWAGHRLIRAGLHWLPATLVVILAVAASSAGFLVRPHVGSIALLGITYALLCDVEAGRAGLRRLAWLVPLFASWANWHGAALGGLATLALVVAGWVLVAAVGIDSPARGRGRSAALAGLLIACGLTAFLNPYGARLPEAWLAIMGSPVLPRLIIEHAPPAPGGPEFLSIAALGAAYLAVLLGTLPGRPRVTWAIPLVWCALALSRVRHAPLFGIVAVLGLADALPRSRVAAWLARPGRDLFRGSDRPDPDSPRRWAWRPAALPVASIVLAVGLQVAGVSAPLFGRGWAGLDPATWPVALLPDLRQAERDHPGGARVYNDHRFGGFLIGLTPGLKVFIDDRCELYGDAFLDRFDRATTTDLDLADEDLDRYRADYALIGSGSPLDRHLADRPGWTLVRRCPVAALYARVPIAPLPAAVLDRRARGG